jgi:hypothetical protein
VLKLILDEAKEKGETDKDYHAKWLKKAKVENTILVVETALEENQLDSLHKEIFAQDIAIRRG